MNMKKSYQHRKESQEINEMITQLQAHIRGFLVRREIQHKNKWSNNQAFYAIKIQVCFGFSVNCIVL